PHSSSHDPATPVLYTLSLHDALPISGQPAVRARAGLRNGESRLEKRAVAMAHSGKQPRIGLDLNATRARAVGATAGQVTELMPLDRKSTRLNSSHVAISYAVFCLKKK